MRLKTHKPQQNDTVLENMRHILNFIVLGENITFSGWRFMGGGQETALYQSENEMSLADEKRSHISSM